jgi:hypothetical protein
MSSDMTQRESQEGLRIAVGNAAFPPGRTEIVLDPSGRLQVTSVLEGADSRREELKVESGRARQLVTMAGDRIAGVRSSDRPGLPDEPRYHFERGDGASVDLWRSDLKAYPELDRLVRELQGAIDEQVRGEILL